MRDREIPGSAGVPLARCEVAIAGCGVICAAGSGTGSLLEALRANTSCLRPNDRFTGPRFQSSIVGTAPIAATTDNPAHQLATLALREAISATNDGRARHSVRAVVASQMPGAHGVTRPTLGIPADRLGLVLSTTKANIETLERLSDGRPCSDAARRHLQADLLAADLAAEFGARGPVQNISNACVSGLVALMQGAKLIQRSAADAVLVVGVDHLSAFVIAGFTALKAIDPEGCRPFDQNRRGLSPGEAGRQWCSCVGIFFRLAENPPLSPPRRGTLQDAPAKPLPSWEGLGVGSARIETTDAPSRSNLITLAGWGSSNDANHMTGPSRDGAGLAQAIRAALGTAQLQPQQIDYVNVHGTGTPYNDAMESAALRTIFGDTIPPVSGVKGMLGHTLGAAGVVETIACVLAMQEQFLPGTPRLQTVAEGLPTSLVKEPRATTQLKHILKLNTGFGGVNGALILSQT